MISFWVIALTMIGVAYFVVLPPLLRRSTPQTLTQDAVNRVLYQTELTELDRDLKNGTLSLEEFEQACGELKRRLLEDVPQREESLSPRGVRRSRWAAPIVVLVLPALAIGLYLKLGAQSEAFAPKSISHPEMAVASTLNPETKIASVDTLVKQLARRLESSPDDAEGWVLLGRSYDHLKRHEEASAAYARAKALGIDSADLISGEAGVQSAAQTKALRASPLAIAGDGNQMLMNLLQRVDADPGDVDGWALLGRSYQALGQYADASEAFERATTLAPNNPQLWADYADALATTQGKQLAGRPMELVQKSLQLDPNQPKALWLAGTAAMQGRDSSSAIEYWERLQKLLPAGSEDARVIGRNIAGIEASSIGIANTLVDRTATVPPANPTGSVRQIRGVVSLDPKLAEQVSDTDTVFVFARAAEGPRVPLAVVRKRAKDLPISFVLDDAMAMLPDMNLSKFSEVLVGARISKSGNATPQPGDLTGSNRVLEVGDDDVVHLVIDRQRS